MGQRSSTPWGPFQNRYLLWYVLDYEIKAPFKKEGLEQKSDLSILPVFWGLAVSVFKATATTVAKDSLYLNPK